MSKVTVERLCRDGLEGLVVDFGLVQTELVVRGEVCGVGWGCVADGTVEGIAGYGYGCGYEERCEAECSACVECVWGLGTWLWCTTSGLVCFDVVVYAKFLLER